MKQKLFTKKEVEQIIELLSSGKSIKEIATITERNQANIYQIRGFYGGVYAAGGISKTVKGWLTEIKSEKQNGVKNSPIVVEPVRDHFAQMKDASEQFETAISAFIEAEIAVRVKAVHEENKKLKETIAWLNKENDDYQKAFLEAKNSNWVDSLRKRWTSPAR